MTHFGFWIDPDPGQDYTLVVQFQDDDDGNDVIPGSPNGADDEFEKSITVRAAGGDVDADGGWQRVSIPLADLHDDNSYHWGGNGVFDPVSTGNGGNGRLVNVVMSLVSTAGADVTFRTDLWEFTREEGAVEGLVWSDADGDGELDGGETGISGATVRLQDEARNEVATTLTAGDGAYSFGPLPAGEYRVQVDASGPLSESHPTWDPDGVSSPYEAWIPAGCSGAATGQGFGFRLGPVAVPDEDIAFARGLRAAVPNPFRTSTRIAFTMDRAGPARLDIYALSGRLVRTLLDAVPSPGPHEIVWDGRDATGRAVAGGIYLVSLVTPDFRSVQRLVRIR
jgi:hypothetical protein